MPKNGISFSVKRDSRLDVPVPGRFWLCAITQQALIKAEAEEQELWEKWQTMRRRAGKSGGGRSQSQAWRQFMQPTRLRQG